MKLWSKVLVGLLSFILIATISIFGLYKYYLSEIQKPVVINDSNVSFEIATGSTVSTISNRLVSLGLLSHPEILKIYLWQHKDKTIQAGFYTLDKNEPLNLIKLVDLFQTGNFNIKLTFLEGWRIEEYGDYLSEKMSPEFAKEFLNSPYIKEGYMFPDTYTIDRNYDASSLASFMRNTFDKKVSAKLFEKAKERGLTKSEVMILASILEREMNISKDKPIVAGIFVKRYENGWPLQADATVQYAKGKLDNWWPKNLGSDVKTFESSYNTYLNKGLPPAPISNPGLDSIAAVVNYVESPYWFYITDNKGITHFSETLEEHNKNVRDFLY